MITPPIESMSVDELKTLKQEVDVLMQQIDTEIKSKQEQPIEEAFQKVSYLDEHGLEKLIVRIQRHLGDVRFINHVNGK